MKETLTMWWLKVILPIGATVLIAIGTWLLGSMDEQEDKIHKLQTEVALLRGNVAINKESTDEFLNVLKDMATGIQDNSKAIIAMEVRVDSLIERNNMMIEALLKQVEGKK